MSNVNDTLLVLTRFEQAVLRLRDVQNYEDAVGGFEDELEQAHMDVEFLRDVLIVAIKKGGGE